MPILTFIELWMVFMEHLRRMWRANRERVPFRTPGSVPLFGTCLYSNCWDQIPRTCHLFTRLFTLNTPWYFLDFPVLLRNCVVGDSVGMRWKSLLNETVIIILSLNQSECRKLLRSASSRIGFSLDTGIEESACKSSCRPLLLVIRKRSSKDLFSLCSRPERPLPWDQRFLRTSGFNE